MIADDLLTPAAQQAIKRAQWRAWQRADQREKTSFDVDDLWWALTCEVDGPGPLELQRLGLGDAQISEIVRLSCQSFVPPDEFSISNEIRGVIPSPDASAILHQGQIWSTDHPTNPGQITGDILTRAILWLHQERLSEWGFSSQSRDRVTATLEEPFSPVLELESESASVLLELEHPQEEIDVHRMLDANYNRAREGLRVVEDIVRFSLNDAWLGQQLKEIRHDLNTAMACVPPECLLMARDTRGDVGRAFSTVQEGHRKDLDHLLRANLVRVQEAFRVMEESLKRVPQAQPGLLEKLRYRLYSLEKDISLTRRAQGGLEKCRLYWLVSPGDCKHSLDWTVREALAGGVQVVQLRDKHATDRELLHWGEQIRQWTAEAGAVFIMNDRPDLARLVQADGVHVGQDEIPARRAREILGLSGWVGVSTHDLAQADQALADGADYLGIGPTFASRTKPFEAYLGPDVPGRVTRRTRRPVFAIGGIDQKTLPDLLSAGCYRVAVSQAICQADDPAQSAHQLRKMLDQACLPVPNDLEADVMD